MTVGIILLAFDLAGAEAKGRVAIFKDDIPVAGAASSPDHLAAVMQSAGLRTDFLTSVQLADPRQLNRERIEVLVLPYGASFPVLAADNFRRFLHAGGKFLSTGGYAFDRLLERTNNGWRPYQPPSPPRLDGAAWFYDIPAASLRGRGPLTFHGYLKTDRISGPGYAHYSVYQVAADGSLPAWRDLCQVRGSGDWKEHRFGFEVHPQAATVSLRAGLYRCRGTAWFDEVRLTDAAGNALLEADFEAPLEPDRQTAGNWWRSNSELCSWQGAVVQAGSKALEVTLGFELPHVQRLNTRHGLPADGLEVEPTQLGVFQADYPLERAQFAMAAPMQSIINPTLRIEGSLAGWAASGVVGFNQARWLPLMNAYDQYGRLRGAAGALLRHYAGPWAGSSWAFFGVTNRDLFAPGQVGLDESLVRLIESLVRDTYMTSLTTDYSCYRPGETVKFYAPVYNGGREARQLRLKLEIFAGEPPETYPARATSPRGTATDPSGIGARNPIDKCAELTTDLQVRPGETRRGELEWRPERFQRDFYYLVARLFEGDAEWDRMESGFLAQDSRVVQSGPKLNVRDNYPRFGHRPLFLFGTDDWGYVFNTTRETPLQWARDMRQRRDLGVMIYENLQFGLPKSPAQQETLLRQVDGIVQLSQKYGQVYFPGLLIGYNAAAGDTELAAQRNYVRDFARRYAPVPGLIYYLNGDYRCELNHAVTPLWNQFLRERYGTDEKLRAAWGRFALPQPLGQIPAEDYHDWEQTWDDVSAYDRNCFRAWLLRRWNGTLVSGLCEFDSSHPTSGEFYQLPHSGVDLPAGIDGLDLGNFGFFEKPGTDLARFPLLCLYNDQRARGKSGGPGEYGVKTHPAWGDGKDYGYHIARSREQALELFLAIPHYALGLGASRLHNWCWKDDAHRVFPWGMVYPCDGVPKDTALVHRNLSLLFRHFTPVYQEPQIYVLTPDSHRLGGAKWKVIEGVLACYDLLLAAHAPGLGTLNEQWLEVPAAAKALFYPLPFCPPDQAYAKVLEWVKRGGVLYLSGDISFDELRRRSRTRRLEELCGVRFVAERYSKLEVNTTNAAEQPCLQVALAGAELLETAADGSPLRVRHRVGRGWVYYTTDPVELHSTISRRARDIAWYRRVLETAGVGPIRVEPDDPRLHILRQPLRGGGQVWILFNTDDTQPGRNFSLRLGSRRLTVAVARHRPALVWLDQAGGIRAIETQGSCVVGEDEIWRDETQGIGLTLDGRDVRHSRALLLMPIQAGQIEWQSNAAWKQPVVETGDMGSGAWNTLELQKAQSTKGRMQIHVASDQALSWLLVCEDSARSRWRQTIENALNHPAMLP